MIIWCIVFFLLWCLAAALSDGKLAGRCCDLLAESLSAFPGNAQVWTWSLYALLQLVSRNSEHASMSANSVLMCSILNRSHEGGVGERGHGVPSEDPAPRRARLWCAIFREPPHFACPLIELKKKSHIFLA